MKRWCGAGALVLALATTSTGGEIVFKDGSRLAGEIASQVLLVSTGSDVVEVSPGDVAVLTPEEVRLKDGRVIRGTLVGGRFRARTGLGELSVELERLELFRDDAAPAPPPPTAVAMTRPAPDPRPAPVAPSGPGQVAEGARTIGRGVEDTAKGVGASVAESADRLHDGFKQVGVTIWEGMKSVARVVQGVFAP